MRTKAQRRPRRTLEELRQSEDVYINASDVGPIMGITPYTIILMAHQQPDRLPFDVFVIGRRVRILRASFLKYVDGRADDERDSISQ